jgi:hypothetical protein
MCEQHYEQGVIDAVSYLSEVYEDVYDTNVLERLGVKKCLYCGALPIAEGYNDTCSECVFTCEECKQDTPYEKGVSWNELCDDCAVSIEKGKSDVQNRV